MNPSVTPAGWRATVGPAETTTLCSWVMCFSRLSSGQGTGSMVVRYLLAEVGKQGPGPSSENGAQIFLDSASLSPAEGVRWLLAETGEKSFQIIPSLRSLGDGLSSR